MKPVIPSPYPLYPSSLYGQSNTYAVSRQSSKAEVTMTTDQGDVVRFSINRLQSLTVSAVSSLAPTESFSQVRLASLEAGQTMISVQGDLSEQELQDIGRLFQELTEIAASFFQGDSDKALAEAMEMGNLGSVNSLTATFSRTHLVAAREVAAVTTPPQGEAQGPGRLPGGYSDLLLGQWRQVRERLSEPDRWNPESSPHEEEKPGSSTTPEDRFLDNVRQLVAEHPRLAPLAGPLGELAILVASGNDPTKGSPFINAWAERFNQWLLQED